MLKRLNQILNIVMGSCLGVWIGHGVYVCWHHSAYPELYAMNSAPWYTSIWVYGIFTLAALAVLAIVKLVVRKMLKSRQ